MSILVRIVALLISIGLMVTPIALALLVASVEFSRPIRASWITPFALAGFIASTGYLLVALAPQRIAGATLSRRMMVAFLMVLPNVIAIYLIFTTDSTGVVVLCVALLATTSWLFSACIWPAWLVRSKLATPLISNVRE